MTFVDLQVDENLTEIVSILLLPILRPNGRDHSIVLVC